jgi:hypothetical protein
MIGFYNRDEVFTARYELNLPIQFTFTLICDRLSTELHFVHVLSKYPLQKCPNIQVWSTAGRPAILTEFSVVYLRPSKQMPKKYLLVH